MIKNLSKITIAVIGGGIFGSTTAIKLAKHGFDVTLFEAGPVLLGAASGINQYRMHQGYHYPRSEETIQSCSQATPLFEKEYNEAIIRNTKNYYVIAREGSHISAEQYEQILKVNNLTFERSSATHINHEVAAATYLVNENLYDPTVLKKTVECKIKDLGIKTWLNTKVKLSKVEKFDFIVVATYASLNEVFEDEEQYFKEYQFEVCEKIVVKPPSTLRRISTVVIDGSFMSFDPYGSTGYSVMGHVEHAIHNRNFGIYPEIPSQIIPMLNKGIITNPSVSSAKKFISEGRIFIPELAHAEYVGSMFTVRTVLPRVDDTDERPTIVTQINDRIITIYSGKVGNSVQAAADTLALIEQKLA